MGGQGDWGQQSWAWGCLPSRGILGTPCSPSGNCRETPVEMGTLLQHTLCKLASEPGRDRHRVETPARTTGSFCQRKQLQTSSAGALRQEASTKNSPKRDGFQEEARRTPGFTPSSLHPIGLGRHQHGGLCSEKRGEGGLGIPMWVLGVGEQQGGGGRESHK